MEIGRAAGVPFKDSQWATRAALGGVFYLVPFLGFVVQGYSLDYMRWVANGRELPLPDWSQFGRYWMRGLLVGLGSMVYALPGVILLVVGVIPIVAAAISESEAAIFGAVGSMCFVFAIGIVYLIAISVFIGAATAHYAMSESFGVFFAVRDIWAKVRENSTEYLTAWGMTLVFGLVAGTVLGTVTGILSVVPFVGTLAGMFVGGFVGYLVAVMSAHLYGQYAAKAYRMPGLAPLPQPVYATVQAPPSPSALDLQVPQAPQAPPAAPAIQEGDTPKDATSPTETSGPDTAEPPKVD